MYNHWMNGWSMGFGWLIPIFFIIAVIYIFSSNKTDEPSARDILDKRYANGEIDDEEYKRKINALKN